MSQFQPKIYFPTVLFKGPNTIGCAGTYTQKLELSSCKPSDCGIQVVNPSLSDSDQRPYIVIEERQYDIVFQLKFSGTFIQNGSTLQITGEFEQDCEAKTFFLISDPEITTVSEDAVTHTIAAGVSTE